MEIVNYKELDKIKPNVSCIGYFDGVHLGHKELIKKTVFYAKKLRVEPCLITFYPDPKSVVSGKQLELINTFEKRCELFEKYGIKKIIIVNFNKKLMSTKPDKFIKNTLSKLKIKRLVCGFDFRYGEKGKGNVNTLKNDLSEGIKLSIVPEVKMNKKKISSTLINKKLSKGHIEEANALLGYDYSIVVSIYDKKIYQNSTYFYGNVIDNNLVKLKKKKYSGYFYNKKFKYNIEFQYNNGIVTFVMNGKTSISNKLEIFIKS